jgi:hypothetical protein
MRRGREIVDDRKGMHFGQRSFLFCVRDAESVMVARRNRVLWVLSAAS